MVSSNEIVHKGIIDSIDEGIVKVSIMAISACASCKAKGMCSTSEMQEKIIEIHNNNRTTYSIGEHVEVILHQGLGFKALFLGYIMPFIVLFLTLIITLSVSKSEGLAGLLSILILIPYYIILYRLKDKFKKTFSFTLRKQYNINY